MKYTKQQLDAAIAQTKLPRNHCRSLCELVAIRWQPLFLGYFVKGIGVLSLALSVYCMCQIFRMATIHPQPQGEELAKLSEPLGKASVNFFLIALFIMYGAEQYLKRTRESRAVCELLMRKPNGDLACSKEK
jgi:hypothetical protein